MLLPVGGGLSAGALTPINPIICFFANCQMEDVRPLRFRVNGPQDCVQRYVIKGLDRPRRFRLPGPGTAYKGLASGILTISDCVRCCEINVIGLHVLSD